MASGEMIAGDPGIAPGAAIGAAACVAI